MMINGTHWNIERQSAQLAYHINTIELHTNHVRIERRAYSPKAQDADDSTTKKDSGRASVNGEWPRNVPHQEFLDATKSSEITPSSNLYEHSYGSLCLGCGFTSVAIADRVFSLVKPRLRMAI
eukprot:scaffold36418_cov191-Amphora_coffeaeformis.AAC.5